MPCVVQMLYKLSSERTRGPWIRRLFRYQEWLIGEGYFGARSLGSSRHFVRDHLRRVERLGFVRRTMVRVLVTRERLVPTDDPA
ncbi:MAG: hypothetical protein OK422_02175 [Thaumarchaeota archaeon]|nr:hypothetical protein [Nitrososphaerota archaeon]